MRAFVIDAESVELTEEECAEYAALTGWLCYPDLQHRVSLWFASIARPQPDSVRDHICRQVERSWRTESRM
jgi:hypothetical protein